MEPPSGSNGHDPPLGSQGRTKDEDLVCRLIQWLPLLPRGTPLEAASVAIHHDEELTLEQVTRAVVDGLAVPRECRQHVLVYQRVLQWSGFRTDVARGVSVVNNKPDPHWALCVARDDVASGRKFLINPLASEVFDLECYLLDSVYSIKVENFVFTFQVAKFEEVVNELKFFRYERAAAHVAWRVSSVKSVFKFYRENPDGFLHFLDFCWRYGPRPHVTMVFANQLLDVFGEIEGFIALSNAQLSKKEKHIVGALKDVTTMEEEMFRELFNGALGLRFRARLKK